MACMVGLVVGAGNGAADAVAAGGAEAIAEGEAEAAAGAPASAVAAGAAAFFFPAATAENDTHAESKNARPIVA
jgi:hypothetical protein